MAGCATPFDLRGASDTQRGFLCWVSSVHAVVGHVHFTFGVECLFASVSRGGALRALAAPILGCTRLRSNLGEYPNVVIQYCSIKMRRYEMKVYKIAQIRGIPQETNCTLRLPCIALRAMRKLV